jgi:hypothetical protein
MNCAQDGRAKMASAAMDAAIKRTVWRILTWQKPKIGKRWEEAGMEGNIRANRSAPKYKKNGMQE